MKTRIARLGHLGLTVADLDRSIDFYTGVLGLRLTERFEYPEHEVGHGVAVAAGAFLRCDATHHCMSIFVLKDGARPEPEGGNRLREGLHHIAFEVGSPEELLTLFDTMRGAGVPIVNSRRGGPGNQPRFYARDPDGNLLEFYWGIDEIGWDGLAREYEPIQEINLHDFDFDVFVRQRERAAADFRRAWDRSAGGSG